jgi:catechol 2,3-dioxygenase-like lactoylglutathione lyase family enzyme
MTERAAAGLGRTIPALQVRDMAAATRCYSERFGFEVRHESDGFAVLVRDEACLHLWHAGDDEWHQRENFIAMPVCSGAESFIAGTASCRIEVADVDALQAELAAVEVLHSPEHGQVSETDHGTREFNTVDADGNLLTFYAVV